MRPLDVLYWVNGQEQNPFDTTSYTKPRRARAVANRRTSRQSAKDALLTKRALEFIPPTLEPWTDLLGFEQDDPDRSFLQYIISASSEQAISPDALLLVVPADRQLASMGLGHAWRACRYQSPRTNGI